MTVEEILAAQQAVLDAADAEGRNLSDEEVEKYEGLEKDLKASQKTAELRSRHEAYKMPVTALVTGAAPKQDDTLERAFNAYLRTGEKNQDIAELRAQSVGTDSAGGYTVPTGLLNKITERLKAYGGLASVANVITTAGGETIHWAENDDTDNSGVIAAEGTAPASGGADLDFGQKTLGAYKYVAPGAGNLPLRVSYELLQDSVFDIEALVARKLATRIARAQAVHWVTGSGSGQPTGIDTSTTVTSTFAAATPDKDELISAIHDVDPEYRMGAVWVFNDAFLEMVRKLEDSTGRPLWTASADAGLEGSIGGTLLGHRVVIDQAFADYTDASGNAFGVFGDISQGYVIRRVRDVQLVVNPYSRANEGQIEYTMWARADGTVDDSYAFTVLKNDAV